MQRVNHASVKVEGKIVGEIGKGLLLLVGVETADTEEDVNWLAGKISRLRIFPDEAGVMNRSLLDTGGKVLAVSQFTLHASLRKGNRPYYGQAAPPEAAHTLYEQFCQALSAITGTPTAQGRFGAKMQVNLENDGPVTIILDSKNIQ